VAKVVLGLKHMCRECGAKYYDMARSPASCPACGAVLQPAEKQRSRRPATAEVKKVATPAVVEESQEGGLDEDLELDTEDLEEDVEEDADGDDDNEDGGDDLIEDVTELGEDDRDVAGVVDEDER
jgi:uncharacterized protein (TIGR02300 family)